MKKKPVAPPAAAELHRNRRPLLRLALIVAAYLFAFIFLDFITKQFEGLPGIVAWYPPAGLTYTLLLVFGVRFAPAVTIALFISSLFIYRMPQPPYLLLLWAFIISLIYSFTAAFLRHRIRIDWQLRKLRDVIWFVFMTVLGSALLAVLSVSSSAMSGAVPRSEVLRAIFDWWIGETVGVLTVAPFLLIYVMPWLKRFVEGLPVGLRALRSLPPPTLSAIGQASSIALVLYWVFGVHVLQEYQPLYLITLPIIWIALQRGFKGVSVALLALNSGLVLALWLFRFDPARLGELELLMIVNCIVGLLMGAVVTERKLAEHSLQEGEARFRALFEQAAVGVAQINTRTGEFVKVNQKYCEIIGFSRAELLRKRFQEISHPDDLPGDLEQMQKLVTGEIPSFTMEKRHYRLDGSIVWLKLTVSPMWASGESPDYHIAVIDDVTERKRTETERQSLLEIMQGVAATESLHELLELIRQSLAKVIYAENFFVVFHNKSSGLFEEVFAVDKYDPAMPPSKLEKSMTSYVFRTGEPLLLTQAKFEELVARGEAELVGTNPAIWLGVPLKTPKETIGVIVVQNYEDPDCYSERDREFLASVGMQVSLAIERKQAEEALHQSEIRYRALVEQNPAVIYTVDSRQTDSFVFISQQIEALSGYVPNAWRADAQLWSKIIHPEDRERVLAENIRTNKTGAPFNIEYRLVHQDGHLVWVHEEARLLSEASGQPTVWQGFMLDITDRKQAEEKIRRQLEHLTALSTIDRVISSISDLELCLSEILTHVTKELGIDAADILLLNSNLQTLEYGAKHGFRVNPIRKAQIRLGESFASRAILERHLVQIPNLRNEPDNYLLTNLITGEDFVCYYGVPLIAKGRVTGVLEIFHRAALEPTAEWFGFLNTLAGRAAMAIENNTLFENMQHSNLELSLAYDATIEGWSHALDLRDKETEGHTFRVSEMTVDLARTLGLGDDKLVQIRRGALLHDIGKMGVPDGILLKPGPLTDEEWVVLKRHPVLAYEMLSPIRYLHEALDIPYCHHEKWDGSGYPRGLKGEEIPLAARIFAVVDVYDALTSDRPYRLAWTREKALEHIREQSGKHFDPKVVKAFMDLMAGEK